jgi:protein phosphatase
MRPDPNATDPRLRVDSYRAIGRASTDEVVRPQFSDIDSWGLTHQGKVRKQNQDHFFLGALARGITVDRTSIDAEGRRVLHAERLASLGMVADGVGSTEGGGEAARIAVRDLVSSVSKFFHEAEHVESEDPEVFSRLLHDAALDCHESLLAKAAEEAGERHFATTLTLFLGLWPHAYLLQIGDSRCYVFRDGELTQITRDQTLAQELVDSGAMTRTTAVHSRWAGVLSSAMGGDTAAPVVTRMERDWGTVILLCSDGLTKHVPDERISERLAAMTSARQVSEQLLQDALDGGGTDNITIVVGRTVPPENRDREAT